MKWRIKDPDHLRDKLIRKWVEARKNGKADWRQLELPINDN
jgi:ppGpp synthetase/RelA/SpoT-type nucleotidyltranferase